MPNNEDTYPLQPPQRLPDQFRTTNWLAGAMVSILRQYFGSTERLTIEKSQLKWDPVIENSQVQIDVVDNLKFTEGEKFPKILVDIENQTFNADVIGDLQDYQPDGTLQFYNRNQTAFSIECWAFKKLEASSIADEVRYFLQGYRRFIMETYGFHYLRVKVLIKPVKYQIYDQYWIARLIVDAQLNEQWGVRKEALEFSAANIGIRTETETGKVQFGGNPNLGVPVV